MTTKSLTAKRVLDELNKCGITHIVWLPDSRVRFMYDAMMSQHEIALVPVCREGEAIAIAVGLRLGGKNPVVLHQDTGFFESGDSVRGLGLDLQLPLLLLLGYHGLSRGTPKTHSAAIFTEPTLDAWGIKHYIVETDEDVGRISIGYKETHETNRPVAILIGREYQ
ncbi:thiamine pyrophosphate-binding protein [Chloroflexota bacterium]